MVCCALFSHGYTVWCPYNPVNFLQNQHKIHPIAHPLGWGMGCILWIPTLIHILSQSLQRWTQYCVILDRVITALDCIMSSKMGSYKKNKGEINALRNTCRVKLLSTSATLNIIKHVRCPECIKLLRSVAQNVFKRIFIRHKVVRMY